MTEKALKVVIVGGVAGGMSAAARLRRLDERAEIVVFERDEYVSFANCGLPYFISGEIEWRDALLLQTPDSMKDDFDIDVRVNSEVISIDLDKHEVHIHERKTGREYVESYDKLVLSTGASAIVPPLHGIDHPHIRTLRNIPDMDEVNAIIAGGAKSAVVIGGGYIGLEMVEALRHRDLEVTLVEAADQVMTVIDPEMAHTLHKVLGREGVRVMLGTKAQGFHGDGFKVTVNLGTEQITTDLVILAVGVKPESSLAREAGLKLADTGAVIVDSRMTTSHADVYAVGDSIQVTDTVSGQPVVIPLAGPANRQGRIAADVISGRASAYSSTQGTGIVRVFDVNAAMTGLNERTLKRLGIDYAKVYLHPNDHAGYYPDAKPMHLKVLFAKDDGRLLGAQAIGADGVDKRIDVIATALRAGMTIEDLEHLELAYAPPFSSAKDPVNMAGFIGGNLLRGDVKLWYAEQLPDLPSNAVILDVRSAREHDRWSIPGSTHIPLDELRGRLSELPAGSPIYAYDRAGFRSYLAQRILVQSGWPESAVLAGGEQTFKAVMPGV